MVLLLFLLFVGVIDCYAWSVLIIHPASSDNFHIIFLAFRTVISVIVYFVVKNIVKHNDSNFIGIVAGILYYLFSIIGLLGVYLIFNSISKSTSKKALIYHIDKDVEEEQDSIIFEKPISINFSELQEVAPLADGMTDDDTLMRIATISAIEETDSTKLFNVLIESKKDKAKEVQYYAHEALKKVGDKYTKKINDLMGKINRSNPDYKTFKELADLYAVLSHKNIEHPILVRFYRQEAIKYYSDLLSNYQEHRKSILAGLISVIYENGDYRLCINYCKELAEDPELSFKSLEYIFRSLFKLRDIESLKELAQLKSNTYPELTEKYLELIRNGQIDG
jgi:hypothetical protein